MSKNGVILVCVTPQRSCRKLIECGKRFAEQQQCTLRILSVLPQGQSFAPDLSALEALNACAGEFGAEMTVLFSDSPAERVFQAVRETPSCTVVTGFPGKNSTQFVLQLHEKLPQTPLWMVDQDGTAYTVGRAPKQESRVISDGTYQIVLQPKQP